jgi:CRP-like cAMP-binding protein
MWSYGLEEIEYKLFYYPKDYHEAENHTDPEIRRRLWYALNRAGLTIDYQDAEKSHLLQLVNETELFGDFSLEAKSLIVDLSKILLFDKDELLDDQRFLSRTMFLVIKGCVLVEQRLDNNVKGNTIIPLHRRNRHCNDNSLAIKPDILEQVSLQLANYIGPVAFYIVAQAAQKASSLYSLYLDLSHEIAEPERRQEFLGYRPAVPTEELRPGDWFGEMSLLLGESLPLVKITTIEETELLAITPRAILRALSHDNLSIDTIAERVVAYHNTYLTATLQEVDTEDLHKNDILERMERNFQSDSVFMS